MAVLKHSHHAINEMGDRGKDTWRFRQAGARSVALAGPGFSQITRVFSGEPPLEKILQALQVEADVILVEGYKTGPLPKVAVLGQESGAKVPPYPRLRAVVSRESVATSLPCFRPDQIEELGRWLYEFLKQG